MSFNNFTSGSDGGYLYAGLIFDHSGNLYGATSADGTGWRWYGFRADALRQWQLDVFPGLQLYRKRGGCGPRGTLVMDGAGNLYGTTDCDGANGYGNVFKLTPSGNGWTYTSLHDFTGGSDGEIRSVTWHLTQR